MIRVISPDGLVEDKDPIDARECVNVLGYRYASEVERSVDAQESKSTTRRHKAKSDAEV